MFSVKEVNNSHNSEQAQYLYEIYISWRTEVHFWLSVKTQVKVLPDETKYDMSKT